ncbi:hypothetical protein LINGRAHAP2_LOCUS35567 [Linum grandiflorum]
MELKGLRSQAVTESVAKKLFLRCFALALILSTVPFLQYWSGSESTLLDPIWGSLECEEGVNLTATVIRELTSKQLLDHNAKALCVGEGSASAVYALRELGFANASGADKHLFSFLPRQKKYIYQLEFEDNSFDFVFSSGDLSKVSVPASLVLEIERTLKPGGVAAALVGSNGGLVRNNLVRSAMPISSLLKSSNIVHVGYVDGYTLVVFKKRFYCADYFEQVSLPSNCHSVANNNPFIGQLEPVVQSKDVNFQEKIAYLPKLMDVSSKNRMVYVDIGAGEHLNSDVASWYLPPSYPVDHKAFNVYMVDHNTSVLHSFVKRPGVTFVYHPGLAGENAVQDLDVEDLDPFVEDQGFDFLGWFKETVRYADFVVMRMNAGEAELKFLIDLFRTGAICSVDELFLNCSGKGLASGSECVGLVKSLRAAGVFVHQWWGD